MPKNLWGEPFFIKQKGKEGKTITPIPEPGVFQIDMEAAEKAIYSGFVSGKVEKASFSKPPLSTPQAIASYYCTQTETLVFYPRHIGKEGYEDSNQGPGPLSFQNIQALLARFFIQSFIDFRIRNWRDYCIGITNYTFNPRAPLPAFMPMFDYDGKNIKKQIRADVKKLQEDFKLGDAWVYHTRRGFHVYFFTDSVEWRTFENMLDHTACCEGFKRSTLRNGFATLRVSAKYTKFDIGLEYILKAAKPERVKRVLRKGHLVSALLDLGHECGTHFASLFPQWAHYQEDGAEWRPGKSPRGAPGGAIEALRRESAYKDKAARYNRKVVMFDAAHPLEVKTASFSANYGIKKGTIKVKKPKPTYMP